jgi:hypothetical protein
VRQDAYQSQVIQIQYASPVGWHPDVEDQMVSRTLAMYGLLGRIVAIPQLGGLHPRYERRAA